MMMMGVCELTAYGTKVTKNMVDNKEGASCAMPNEEQIVGHMSAEK